MRRLGWVLAVFGVIAGVAGCVAEPGGAPPSVPTTTTTFTTTCSGANAASNGILSALGGAIDVNQTVTVQAPSPLVAGQLDVDVSHRRTLTLNPAVTGVFASVSPSGVEVRNARFDLDVSGATATTSLAGRPPAAPFVAGPSGSSQMSTPTFAGRLTGIGPAGTVTVRVRQTTFTFRLVIGGTETPVDLTCPSDRVVAVIPVS